MITQTDILEKAPAFVAQQFSRAGDAANALHNLSHTQALVARTQEIGAACALGEEDMRLVLLAAWLHDISYIATEAPAPLPPLVPASEFLQLNGLSGEETEAVQQCVAASHYPQRPQSKKEEVLCDAVSSFMADPDYLAQAEKQMNADTGKKTDAYEWIKSQRALLKQHAFFTKYAKRTYTEGKEANLKLLKKKRREFSKDNEELEALWEENLTLRRGLEKERAQKAGKGIETMFRTTMASHLQLSVMADSKANLMISINAIIASIMISSFVRKFDEVPHLIIPSILLTLVCVFTIVFAVLSTRPNIKRRTAGEGTLDYLFFGDFVQLTPESYKDGIRSIMYKNDDLYNSMISNIYMQGKVLAKKYRLLKISYTIFMVGFVVVLLSYAFAWLFLAPPQ
ncbi:Pycsar system effector family protein [Pontibacter russatus]|uniref:Pycsar system effector family protein n=1 Tax=Pontibacter russatus TaxID=2694929 RepID=UPI001379DC00|nr:Pycsar system effector family protein [Pontibacter russatus]